MLVALVLVACEAHSQQFHVDGQQSSVTFRIRNFGLEVEGSLGNVRGSIVFDDRNPAASSFRLSADASTIDTGIYLRDRHLQKKEYLDATTCKTLDFTSTRIEKTRTTGELVVTGNLTIKNTTKEIQVPLILRSMNGHVEFAGTFTIDRQDYDVGDSSLSLADDVIILFTIQAGSIKND